MIIIRQTRKKIIPIKWLLVPIYGIVLLVVKGSPQYLTKGHKMTTATKATTKAVKTIAKASNDVDGSLASVFSSIVGGSLEAEFNAFWDLHEKMAKGALSVTGAKATVKVAEEIGSLPSFRSSWCQHVLVVGILFGLEGGKDRSLKSLFNIAVQGVKVHGTEELKKVIGRSKSVADVEATIPAQGSRGAGAEQGGKKGKKVGDLSTAKVDDLMGALSNAIKGGATVDVRKARVLVAELQKAIKKVEATTPQPAPVIRAVA